MAMVSLTKKDGAQIGISVIQVVSVEVSEDGATVTMADGSKIEVAEPAARVREAINRMWPSSGTPA